MGEKVLLTCCINLLLSLSRANPAVKGTCTSSCRLLASGAAGVWFVDTWCMSELLVGQLGRSRGHEPLPPGCLGCHAMSPMD